MLKRNIAVLIAGALLSAQAGLAVADPDWRGFPEGADQYQYWKPLPAVEKYLAERAASNPIVTGASGSPFPQGSVGSSGYIWFSSAQAKYFAERAAKISPERVMRTSEGFDADHMKSQPN